MEPAIHVFLNFEIGRHYAGSFLPPGGMLMGAVRVEGSDAGALVLLPRGLWVRYRSGQIDPLPGGAGAAWIAAIRKERRLNVEECAGLAGVREETARGWETGGAVGVGAARRLMRALRLGGDP